MPEREFACFDQFLLLTQCLQRSSDVELSESVYMWERAMASANKIQLAHPCNKANETELGKAAEMWM